MASDGKEFPLSSVRPADLARLKAQEPPKYASAQGGIGLHPFEKIESPEAQKASERLKAATQFEALLLQQMLQNMWRSVPNEGNLSGSREEGMYRDMFTEAVANDIASKQSLGLRDQVVKEMEQREGIVPGLHGTGETPGSLSGAAPDASAALKSLDGTYSISRDEAIRGYQRNISAVAAADESER